MFNGVALRALAVACAGLALLAGCVSVSSERTSNQGGGSMLTAGAKVANNQLADLTADEIQLLADMISELAEEVDIFLTDEDAAVIRDFLMQNNLNSIEDIQNLIAEAQAADDPLSVVVIPRGAAEFLAHLDQVITLTTDELAAATPSE